MNFKVFLFCLSLAACTNAGQNSIPRTSLAEDSTNPGPDLTQVRNELIASYSHPITIDTILYSNDKTFKVTFRHFATMDAGVTVPAKYNFDTNSEFATHNFKSELLILTHNDTILSKEITKQTFKEYLYPELDSFGTLSFPILHINNDTINISYSLGIPVTDIGIPVSIMFDTKGHSHISN